MAEEQTDAQTPEGTFGWGRVLALFRPHRSRVALVVLLVLSVSGLGIVNPLLMQVVFDDGLFPSDGPIDLGVVVSLSLVMLGVTAVSGVLGVYQTIATNRLGQDVLRDLRDRLYRHLQQLSLSFYSGTRTGDLQSRITSDVGGIQTAVTSTISNILWNSVTFIGALIAMAVLSWQLMLLSLATVPFFVLATRWVGSRRERYTGQTQAATAEMSVITQETLSVSGITLSKLFGRQEAEIERFHEANERLSAAATAQQVIGQAFFTIVQAFMGATPIITYLVAGWLLDRGTGLTAGTIVAFTTLQSRLFFPVARLLETTVELQSSRALFRRIFAYLDAEPDIQESSDPVRLPREDVHGALEFDTVHFSYDGDPAHAALDDVSFEARPGQLIAFVGPSGSGKSTVLSLAARLYDPTGGAVTIDGIDLRDLSARSMSDLLGFVTQESYLFAGTIRDNISYGDPDASDAEIEKVARAASIHDRIQELPEGYDTLIGERGSRLSGGERQRVAIARVLLHDPKLLVLDEATSALDTASERRIQEALGELISSRTTLAVAHRLSTIQAADVIHVIDHGQIVESGNHDALLALGGAYADLYREQFGDGQIETTCSDGVVFTDGRCEYFKAAASDGRLAALKSR
ncbi:MAG: ABC transporter ATP-binding protein [Actinomycetota bacterium]